MPDFIPGLKLAELFFHEEVKPLLDREFPTLRFASALIGSGSEVLGFDTAMSTDHHWGPRAMLFLAKGDFANHRNAIHDLLRHKLPHSFHGFPTNFTVPDPNDGGTQLLKPVDTGPINHRVEIFTISGF